TFGSPILANNIPTEDERMVAVVRSAGAIVVGKTNAPEFGAGGNTTNPVFGATGNPFDPSRICGGSSGGSAVALATSMLPLATGSDTGGSLRTPAAYCGVIGFRPSPGAVPMSRRAIGYTPISVQGPMGRDVADTALMFSAVAGYDPVDPLSFPMDTSMLANPPQVDLSGLRVAVSEDLGFAPVDNGVRQTFRDAIAGIKSCFREVVDAPPPLDDANEIFEVLRATSFYVSFEGFYREKRELLGANLVANIEQALGYSFADAAQAQAKQNALYQRFSTYMEDFDILLSPTAAVPPFPLEQLYPTHINDEALLSYFHWLGLGFGTSLTGFPSVTLPCGLDATGTPFGLHICGQRFGDHQLMGVAAALEQYLATVPGLGRPLPDIGALSA
ncbi:MAG: amidase family protein, partial [Burkholderiaceae bacterium]